MKKWIHSVIAVLLASICLLPSAAFAADNTDTVPEGGYIATDPTEDDVIFTQEDLLILDAAEDYGATATGARTSGLITSATLKFAMNSNTMTISGLTKCVSGVKKCGFTKVVVMRRLNASYTWSPYKTYKDLYKDGTTYSLSKKLVVNPGWYYYVEGVHYAKKNALSTQKITSETGVKRFNALLSHSSPTPKPQKKTHRVTRCVFYYHSVYKRRKSRQSVSFTCFSNTILCSFIPKDL